MSTSRNSVYLDGRSHRQLKNIGDSHYLAYGKKVSNSQIIRRALSLLQEMNAREGFNLIEKNKFTSHRKAVY